MVVRRFALLATVAGLLAGGCSSSTNGYTRDTEGTFIEACAVKDAQPLPFCHCLYDEIRQKVPFDRYVDNDKKMQADKDFLPDEYLPLAADCGSRVDSSSSSSS
jgi:hypothetical protein